MSKVSKQKGKADIRVFFGKLVLTKQDKIHLSNLEARSSTDIGDMVRVLLEADNGDFGPCIQEFIQSALRNTQRVGQELAAFFNRKYKSRGARPGAKTSNLLHAPNSVKAFKMRDIVQLPPGLVDAKPRFIQKVCAQAAAVIKGHKELLIKWEKDKQEWEYKKSQWEQDHTEYMEVSQRMMQTNRLDAEGLIRWFQESPDMACWRQGNPVVAPFKARKSKNPGRARFAAFFKANPELDALRELHNEYKKDWLEFDRKPTLTIPSSERPRRLQFLEKRTDAYSGYKLLNTKQLRVMGQYPGEDAKVYQVKLDKRVVSLNAESGVVEVRENKKLLLYSLKAITLLPEGQLRIAAQSLHRFVKSPKISRIEVKDELGNKYTDGCEIAETVRILGFDYGERNELWAVIMDITPQLEYTIVASKRLESTMPLRKLLKIEQKLNKLKRLRGKPVYKKRSFIRLTAHLNNARDERIQTLINAVVAAGLEYKVDVICHEALSGLRATKKTTKGRNRRMANLKTAVFFERLEAKCHRHGIACWSISPYGTSQTCSRCCKVGCRVEQTPGGLSVNKAGKLFHCEQCEYLVNADHNAAVNIVLRLVFGRKHVQAFKDHQDQKKGDKKAESPTQRTYSSVAA